MTAVATLRALWANAALRTSLLAWFALVLSDKALRIGSIAYAFARGGPTAAGLVAMVQLLPGIVVVPALMAVADRRRPLRVLAAAHAAQTVGLVVTALAVQSGAGDVLAYAGATLAATAAAACRPAHSVVPPRLAHSAEQLSASSAVQGWLNSLGFVLAGVLAGALLGLGEPALLFGVVAAVAAVAGLLAVWVSGHDTTPVAEYEDAPDPIWRTIAAGVHIVATDRAIRLLVALNTAQYLVIAAMDVLFVTLAVDVLHRHAGWAGYLSTAFGVGAVLAGSVTIALVGRPLGRPLLIAVGIATLAQVALTGAHGAPLAIGLLVAAGAGRAVVTTATQALLQRTARLDLLGRVAGVAEGLRTAGLAIGSALVPLLVASGGPRIALIGTAAVMPLAIALGARGVRRLDDAADIPVTEIALLQSMPHFRALPMPELEGLARQTARVEVADGEVILRQGDIGELFYALAQGSVDVSVDGAFVATRHAPAGLGEIALLHEVPRTATVVAAGPVVLYALDGADFLRVVTGHEPTLRRAGDVARERLGTAESGRHRDAL